MALVITLILLAVTLVMALAFLAISSRERGSINTATETATARLAMDSGLAAAEGQIVANVLSTKNPYSYGLLVSTNFINGAGFDPATAGYDPNNVNYDYLTTGGPLSPNQFEQNLANLYYSPRAPVFVPQNGTNDFRFYLDLNRNGIFDANGSIPNVGNAGNILLDGAGKPIVTSQAGDPEWIGVLEHPDQPYGPNNKFIARYLFYCLPAGNQYDLNYLHNQTLIPPLTYPVNPMVSADDSYYRNQGVGSWEINLAAFLADLNTNQWDTVGAPYNYLRPALPNTGFAFEDAFALLNYRYAGNYSSLAPVGGVTGLFTTAALFPPFQNNIDFYSDITPPMTFPSVVNAISQPVTVPWAGADNTNHFFDLTADLFDPAKITPNNFINHLQQAGNGSSTYDRYTFYRLLDQLGTDSAPESGKMNLNYDNLTPNTNGVASATNFFAWTPAGFFTNAADRMLRAYTTEWLGTDTNSFNNFTNTFGASVTGAFGVSGIPVLVDGRMVYSPAVQRILQLAANMYDATTSRSYDASGFPLPTVFQPIFSVQGGINVYITSFVEVTNTAILGTPPLDINFGLASLQPNSLVFGVPLIIGAKKGLPNFNQFALQTAFNMGRKLQITRTSADKISAPVSSYKVNERFVLGLTNQLGVECWNSYGSDYTRPVLITANDRLSLTLTNDEGFNDNFLGTITYGNATNVNVWPHFNPSSPNASFILPLDVTLFSIPAQVYQFSPPGLYPTTVNPPFETGVTFNGTSYPQPKWGLVITNDLQVAMVDTTVIPNRIIDYVQLVGPNTSLSLDTAVDDTKNTLATGYNGMWVTNNPNNVMPHGIANQIGVSLGTIAYDGSFWTAQGGNPQSEIDGFRAFYHMSLLNISAPGEAGIVALANTNLTWQAPYTPSTNLYQYITWQANDPLVHYLASDLTDKEPFQPPINPYINPNAPNHRYQPWGARMLQLDNSDPNTYNLWIKDPLVKSSDFWDFPTNKFPTVGWLGRVHRGTPWQTVYLKAGDVVVDDKDPTSMQNSNYGLNTWENWTGDFNTSGNEAANFKPTQDRLLFDLFTTAPNDNATRGQLPVNQKNFAAWSALFSGMAVPTNLAGAPPMVINPAGANGSGDQYLMPLFNSITAARTFANLPTKAFKHVGDVLSASALTEKSPFLTGLDPVTGISDELYEWLPQQMMSLLKVSSEPRYVIYSIGQTLAPAGANAVITAGGTPFSGMITNYQVVAETAARTVVRIVGSPTNTHAVVESFNIMPPK